MIERVTLKKYQAIMRNRKMSGRRNWPGIYFKGNDGKYYRCDKDGIEGAQEVARFKKKERKIKNQQLALFE